MAELDWFDFETRIRAVVLSFIEPLTDKLCINKQEIEKRAEKSKELNRRLKVIEGMVGTSEHTTGWMKEIEQRINKNTENLKVLEVASEQTDSRMKSLDESRQLENLNLTSNIEYAENSIENLQSQLNEFTEVTESNKKTLELHFASITSELQKTYNRVMTETSASQQVSHEAIKLSIDTQREVKGFSSHLEELNNMLRDIRKTTLELSEEKLNKEDLVDFNRELKRVSLYLEDNHREAEAFQRDVCRYLEVYVPIETNIAVADQLMSFMKCDQLKRWSRYFREQQTVLQQKSFEDAEGGLLVDGLMKRAIHAGYDSEIRLNTVIIEMRKMEAESLLINPPMLYAHGVKTKRDLKTSAVPEEVIKQPSSYSEIAAPFISNEDIEHIRNRIDCNEAGLGELKLKLTELKGNLVTDKATQREIREFVSSIHSETQASVRMTREDRILYDKQMLDTLTKVEQIEDTFHKTTMKLGSLEDSLKHFAEGLKMLHAIITPEDEDKATDSFHSFHSRKTGWTIGATFSNSIRLPHPSCKYNNKSYSKRKVLELIGENLVKCRESLKYKEEKSKTQHIRKRSMDTGRHRDQILNRNIYTAFKFNRS